MSIFSVSSVQKKPEGSKYEQTFIRILQKENGKRNQVELSLSQAAEVVDMYNRIYYVEDIEHFFEESTKYDSRILLDKDLMYEILANYADLRNNADGGDIEDTLHWSECLRLAVENPENEYYDRVLLYGLLDEDGTTLLSLLNFTFKNNHIFSRDDIANYFCEQPIINSTLCERLYKIYTSMVDEGKDYFLKTYGKILKSEKNNQQ